VSNDNLILARVFQRPDQPQPVYQPLLDQTVRTWAPIWAAELASFRTPDGPKLDVRRGPEWAPEFFGLVPLLDATVRTWIPIFDAELALFRMADRWLGPLPTEAEQIWFYSLPPAVTVPQMWPAFLEAAGISYRMADRWLGPISTDPEFTWPWAVVNPIIVKWAPIFAAELASTRSPDRTGLLELRYPPWFPDSASWIFPNLPPIVVKQLTFITWNVADTATTWRPSAGFVSWNVFDTFTSFDK
jgi:hypothetical protein